jgi:flagellar protein FlgJ
MSGITGTGGLGSLLSSALSEQDNLYGAVTAASVNSVADAQAIAAIAESDSFESKLRSAMTSQNDAELKDACVQFEELMLGILYKSMKATVQRSELIPEAPGREIYEQWQDDALMKNVAQRGTFGLADMMYKQLSKRMKNAYDLVDE